MKGFKASGNRLLTEKKYSKRKITKILLFESLPYEPEKVDKEINEIEVKEPVTFPEYDKTQIKLKF